MDNLHEYISDEVSDFRQLLEDGNGTVHYAGQWLSVDEAIDLWCENETRKFSQTLWEALNDAKEEYANEHLDDDTDA